MCQSSVPLRHFLGVPLKGNPIQRKRGSCPRGCSRSRSLPSPWCGSLGPGWAWSCSGLMVGLREQNQRSQTGGPFTPIVQFGKWKPKGVKQLLKATGLAGSRTNGKNQVSFSFYHVASWAWCSECSHCFCPEEEGNNPRGHGFISGKMAWIGFLWP